MTDHFRRQIADPFSPKWEVDRGKAAASHVHCYQGQRLVERDDGVSHPHNAPPFTERFVEGLTQAYPHVLNGVMGIPMYVASGLYRYVDETMPGDLLKQVIEHSDTGIHNALARTIEIEH
jgi:hypothetical protein